MSDNYVFTVPFEANGGLSFAVSALLQCRLWVAQGGTAADSSDGQMLGYKMADCEHISDVVPIVDIRSLGVHGTLPRAQ